MSRRAITANPFYLLVVIAGLAFCVTACAYGVMLIRVSRHADAGGPLDAGLMGFLSRHGELAIGVELGALALATIAAIGTDDYWARRARRIAIENPIPPIPEADHEKIKAGGNKP